MSEHPRRRISQLPQFPQLVSLAARLEHFRHARRLTQRELAKRAGLSTNHYQDVAHAQTNPTAALLLRLASALGVTIADLFDTSPVIPAIPPHQRAVQLVDLRALAAIVARMTQ